MQQVNAPPPPSQSPPWGFSLFPILRLAYRGFTFHKYLVLLITFFAYASFHASRKPPSIVKSVLGPDPDQTRPDTGWPPFNGTTGPRRLADLDLAFLSAYSVGMFFAGHLGDRYDLRLFLTIGMVSSGFLTVLFGLGFWCDVHSLSYFLIIQFVCGAFQSIGWPCVVAVVGNWFQKSNRGFIMGLWNSHTSVGNIVGSVLASSVLGFGWGWAFLLPGILLLIAAAFVFFFLVVNPENIGLQLPNQEEEADKNTEVVALLNSEVEFVNSNDQQVEANTERVPLVDSEIQEVEMNMEQVTLVDSELPKAEETNMEGVASLHSEGLANEDSSSAPIGFFEAWGLPDVAQFALCLFFSKLVAYTFLYWLPFYIRHTAVDGVHLSHKTAGILSTLFDIGGVIGGILAGYTSDRIDARAVTSFSFLALSVPALILYHTFGSVSMFSNVSLMFLCGLLVNGPYALITTAVAADLGTQSVIRGNSRALATVSAIIDGTGSAGAALGPFLAGYISTFGWKAVFLMLVLSSSAAALLLLGIVRTEVNQKVNEGKWLWLGPINTVLSYRLYNS